MPSIKAKEPQKPQEPSQFEGLNEKENHHQVQQVQTANEENEELLASDSPSADASVSNGEVPSSGASETGGVSLVTLGDEQCDGTTSSEQTYPASEVPDEPATMDADALQHASTASSTGHTTASSALPDATSTKPAPVRSASDARMINQRTEYFSRMNVKQLRDRCKKNKLETHGNKADLINRLVFSAIGN